MNITTLTRTAVALAAATVIAACGGGEDPARAGALDFAQRVATQGASAPDGRMRILANAPVAAATPSRAITNAELFAFAQTTFPQLFPGTPTTHTVPFDGKTFDVRAYSNGNYLGIANGVVYGLGPFTGNALVSFGEVQSFACQAVPSICNGGGGGGGGGSLNGCVPSADVALTTGFRTHLIYQLTGLVNSEHTTDTVVDGPMTFEGQTRVQTTATTTSTTTVNIGGGVSTTTNTTAKVLSYMEASGNGLLKRYGDMLETTGTSTTTIPNLPPQTTTTNSRSKIVYNPASENTEFTLAVGGSIDKTDAFTTTVLAPTQMPPVSDTTTIRYTYEAREPVNVLGRSFDTCRYKTTIEGVSTTAWLIFGKGVLAKSVINTEAGVQTMELKPGSTYNGAAL